MHCAYYGCQFSYHSSIRLILFADNPAEWYGNVSNGKILILVFLKVGNLIR